MLKSCIDRRQSWATQTKPLPVCALMLRFPIAAHRIVENNLALQQRLYDLRTETKDAFEDAKSLEARWKELDKEQKEVYQVILIHPFLVLYLIPVM